MSATSCTVREEWGMACPQCGADDQLEIEALVTIRLVGDTSEDVDGTREWDNASPVRCGACGHASLVHAFRTPTEEGEDHGA